jgi:hypothetical protein
VSRDYFFFKQIENRECGNTRGILLITKGEFAMSTCSIAQPSGSANRRGAEFVKLAFDELVQKYPEWYEHDQLCLEYGYWLASTDGVKQTGESLFEVNHDLQNAKPYVVNGATQTCDCPEHIAKTTELGHQHRCCHRIAVYLFIRARALQRQFDAEWQQFLRETCDGDPRGYVIGEDEQEYLVALAESKAWHAAQAKKGYILSEGEGQGHQAKEQLPLFGASPQDEEKFVAMSRLQTIRRTYIPVVDFRIVRESSIAVEAAQIKSSADAANILFASHHPFSTFTTFPEHLSSRPAGPALKLFSPPAFFIKIVVLKGLDIF